MTKRKNHPRYLINTTVLSLLFLICFYTTYAQDMPLTLSGRRYTMTTERVSMSKGLKDGVSAQIPAADPKASQEEWKKFISSYGKKTKSGRSEVVTSNADMLGKKVNIYALFASAQDGTKVTVFLQNTETKDFLPLTEDASQAENISNMLDRFGEAAQRATVEKQKEAQEKLLKTLQKDYDKLVSSTEKLKKSIEKSKNSISKAENKIAANEEEQRKKKEDIAKQEETIRYIGDKLNDFSR